MVEVNFNIKYKSIELATVRVHTYGHDASWPGQGGYSLLGHFLLGLNDNFEKQTDNFSGGGEAAQHLAKKNRRGFAAWVTRSPHCAGEIIFCDVYSAIAGIIGAYGGLYFVNSENSLNFSWQ